MLNEKSDILLCIENLKVHFTVEHIDVKAVDGVSFNVRKDETLALIGESGSGKSVLGMTVLRLLPENTKIDGRIIFNGSNLLELSEDELRKIRGKEIAWVPQNPSTSLNPVLKVGIQVAEPTEVHLGMSRRSSLRMVAELFKFFDITPAERRIHEYPHQFSGGMRQRALVAMSVSTNPRLIIADEPTKGIDAIKKSLVAELFKKIKGKASMLLITHDLGLAEKLADRIAVMYCGKIVEIARADDFYEKPLHPYSKALLNSLPSRGLKPIRGSPPSMINPPKGCRFHPRCEFTGEECLKDPPLIDVDGNLVGCWLYD